MNGKLEENNAQAQEVIIHLTMESINRGKSSIKERFLIPVNQKAISGHHIETLPRAEDPVEPAGWDLKS